MHMTPLVANLDDVVKIATALSLLLGALGIGTIINKRLPERVGPMDLFERVQVIAERNEERIADLEATQRLTLDYVHELRLHIADGKPPPPPAWPEGLSKV